MTVCCLIVGYPWVIAYYEGSFVFMTSVEFGSVSCPRSSVSCRRLHPEFDMFDALFSGFHLVRFPWIHRSKR